MGVDETFCNTNGTGESSVPEVIQQPIAQANHFEFAPTHIELTSATGKCCRIICFEASVLARGSFDSPQP